MTWNCPSTWETTEAMRDGNEANPASPLPESLDAICEEYAIDPLWLVLERVGTSYSGGGEETEADRSSERGGAYCVAEGRSGPERE